MSDDQAMFAAAAATAATFEQKSGVCHKYTRAQLFAIAKCMHEPGWDVQRYKQLEEVDHEQLYAIMRESEAHRDQHDEYNSLMAHISDTYEHGFSSLQAAPVHNNSWRGSDAASVRQQRNSVRRLTSNPTNNNNNSSRFSIDATRMDSAAMSQARPRQPLCRTSSYNAYEATTQPQVSYASFNVAQRRDNATRWSRGVSSLASTHDHRRMSDEPMSLPFMSDYQRRDEARKRFTLSSQADRTASRYGQNLIAFNARDAEPIKRIRANSKDSQDIEEDDEFDITNLLSITVLSDIKTIRQDSHHQHHHSPSTAERNSSFSNRGRSVSSSKLSSPIASTNDEHCSMPSFATPTHHAPLSRASSGRIRTSGIRSAMINTYDAQTCRYDSYDDDRYSSLPAEPYSWTANYIPPVYYEPVRAQTATPIVNAAATRNEDAMQKKRQQQQQQQKNIDADALKIIETFKAQVIARAKEDAAIDSPKMRQQTNENAQKKAETVSKETGAVASDKADHEKGDVEAKQAKASTITSQIPRYIPLYKSLSASRTSQEPTNTPAKSGTRSDVVAQVVARLSGGSSSNSTTPVRTRPASLYKQLRGKSLADEVSEIK